MTSAPACPTAIAAAWPIPELAPVTSAFWPARTFAMVRSGAPREELRMIDSPADFNRVPTRRSGRLRQCRMDMDGVADHLVGSASIHHVDVDVDKLGAVVCEHSGAEQSIGL